MNATKAAARSTQFSLTQSSAAYSERFFVQNIDWIPMVIVNGPPFYASAPIFSVFLVLEEPTVSSPGRQESLAASQLQQTLI